MKSLIDHIKISVSCLPRYGFDILNLSVMKMIFGSQDLSMYFVRLLFIY